MSAINGMQLARLWAKAWKDNGFRKTLEANPLQAAKDFKTECDTKKYAPFPDPTKLQLLDLDKYGQPGLDFKKMPKDKLDEIIGDGVNKKVPWWIMSKFFPLHPTLGEALKNGELEIRNHSDDEHY